MLAKTGGSVCLADYGLLFIVEQADFTRHKIAGPARWAAPEVLDPPANVAPHSEATDVYAFAMTVVEVRVPRATSAVCSCVHCADLYGQRALQRAP